MLQTKYKGLLCCVSFPHVEVYQVESCIKWCRAPHEVHYYFACCVSADSPFDVTLLSGGYSGMWSSTLWCLRLPLSPWFLRVLVRQPWHAKPTVTLITPRCWTHSDCVSHPLQWLSVFVVTPFSCVCRLLMPWGSCSQMPQSTAFSGDALLLQPSLCWLVALPQLPVLFLYSLGHLGRTKVHWEVSRHFSGIGDFSFSYYL